MYMNTVNEAGFIHHEKNIASQDFISCINRRGIHSMCLCDGAGSYMHTDVGAKFLARRLAGFMSDQFYNLLAAPEKEIVFRTVHEIQACISCLRMDFGCKDPNAFASTAICCAMEVSTGRYIALQLGDGFLGAISGGHVRRLVPQKVCGTGDQNRATMLSTSSTSGLIGAVRIVFGQADGILMCSDGAEGWLYDRFGDARNLCGTLIDGVKRVGPAMAEALLAHTARSFHSFDDVSIGLMLRKNPNPQTLGFVPGSIIPHRRSMQQKARLRKMTDFAKSRAQGLSPKLSARRAHCGRRNRRDMIKYSAENLCVY